MDSVGRLAGRFRLAFLGGVTPGARLGPSGWWRGYTWDRTTETRVCRLGEGTLGAGLQRLVPAGWGRGNTWGWPVETGVCRLETELH